jgi:hypothetical protein
MLQTQSRLIVFSNEVNMDATRPVSVSELPEETVMELSLLSQKATACAFGGLMPYLLREI